jgi:cold shock CspA family protein
MRIRTVIVSAVATVAIAGTTVGATQAYAGTVDQKVAASESISTVQSAADELPSPKLGLKYIGRVKWFDHAKGFGFIAIAGYADVFVHIAHVAQHASLYAGQAVGFVLNKRATGYIATDVYPA